MRKYAIFYDYFKILIRLQVHPYIPKFLRTDHFVCVFSLVSSSSNCIEELPFFSMLKLQLPPFPGIKELKVKLIKKSIPYHKCSIPSFFHEDPRATINFHFHATGFLSFNLMYVSLSPSPPKEKEVMTADRRCCRISLICLPRIK